MNVIIIIVVVVIIISSSSSVIIIVIIIIILVLGLFVLAEGGIFGFSSQMVCLFFGGRGEYVMDSRSWF